MATLPTAIGPIGTRQINRNLYVGQGDLTTIQVAINAAVKIGGLFTIVIPLEYAGSETIASLTGGTTNIIISDRRYGQIQTYEWNGAQFVAGRFQQGTGFVSLGAPIGMPPGSASFYFDPIGTSGAGTGHVNVTAPTGFGMPAVQLVGVPSDGTAQQIYLRGELSGQGQYPMPGLPQVEMPCQLGLFNLFNNFSLWTGQGYVSGGKGMTVWTKPDENAIDLQGLTIAGNYDQTIRLNYLGGGVQIGPITFDASGNIIGIDSIDATSIVAADATFDTCEVNNSPVRTFDNTPDGPGEGMVWPPIGVPVSLGSSWQNPSIDPTTIALLNSGNSFTDYVSATLVRATSTSTLAKVPNSIWMDFLDGVGRLVTVGPSAGVLSGFQFVGVDSVSGGLFEEFFRVDIGASNAVTFAVDGRITSSGRVEATGAGTNDLTRSFYAIGTTGTGGPYSAYFDLNASAGNKFYDEYYDGNGSRISRLISDDASSVATWMQVNRTGQTCTSVSLNTSSLNVTGNLVAASSTGYLSNAATPSPMRVTCGFVALVNGSFNVAFAKPFGAGQVYVGSLTVISSNAAGSTATPYVWIVGASNTGISGNCSSATATNTVFWVVYGNP